MTWIPVDVTISTPRMKECFFWYNNHPATSTFGYTTETVDEIFTYVTNEGLLIIYITGL